MFNWNYLCTLAASCSHGVKNFHLNVVVAFLNGDIIQVLYIEPPEWYGMPRKEDFVCRLFKALYGIKQAPRAWYSKIDSFLSEKWLLTSDADYNLYYFEEGGRIALRRWSLYDWWSSWENKLDVRRNQETIHYDKHRNSFSLTRNWAILHEHGIITTQRRYITTTLEEFGLIDYNPSPTPILKETKL